MALDLNTTSKVEYPPDMSTVTIEAVLQMVGRPRSGRYRVEAERKVTCTYDPSWIQDRFSQWFLLVQGRMVLELPASDDPGLRGDDRQPLPTPLGYKITLKPYGSEPIQMLKFTVLPRAKPLVGLGDLADLGGWPNQTVIVTPPPTAANIQLVLDPDPQDLGLVYVTDDGTI